MTGVTCAPRPLACVGVPRGVPHPDVAHIRCQLDESGAFPAEGHLQGGAWQGGGPLAVGQSSELGRICWKRTAWGRPRRQPGATGGVAWVATPSPAQGPAALRRKTIKPRPCGAEPAESPTLEKSLAAAFSGSSRAAASRAPQCRPPLRPRTVGMRGLQGDRGQHSRAVSGAGGDARQGLTGAAWHRQWAAGDPAACHAPGWAIYCDPAVQSWGQRGREAGRQDRAAPGQSSPRTLRRSGSSWAAGRAGRRR